MRLLTSVLDRFKIAKFISSEEGQVAFENAQRDIVNIWSDVSYLEVDVSNNTTTLDSTDLAVEIEAGKVYILDAILTYQSSLLANGIGIAFNLPTGAQISGIYLANNTATQLQGGYNTSSDGLSGTTTDVPVANQNLSLIGKWIVKADPQSGGTVRLRFKAETANQVTLKGGLCVLRLTKVV